MEKEKQLVAAHEAQKAEIVKQQQLLAQKKKQDQILAVQARLDALAVAMENEQATLVNLQSELASPANPGIIPPVTSVPATTVSPTQPTGLPAASSAPLVNPARAHPPASAVTNTPTFPVYPSPVMSIGSAASLTGQAPPTPTYAPLAPALGTIGAGSQRDGPFVVPTNPAPASTNQGAAYFDPARQVYVDAITGQYRGTLPARQPGATAAQLVHDYPALAAATGFGGIAAAAQPEKKEETEYTTGKSSAEQFIFKPPVKDRDKPSFYEFIHGALKMMRYRVQYDKKPVLEYLVYYERLANLACQYKWWSVYDLHTCLAEAVKDERASWGDEIATTDVHRYCKERDQLNTDSDPGEGRRARRDLPRHNRRRDSDRSDSNSHSRDSRDGFSRKDGLCIKYNKEPTGCPWGDSCQFFHRCSECDRSGIREAHPALWCTRTTGSAGGNTAAGGSAR